MLLTEPRKLLKPADVPAPKPGPNQLLIKVRACGVCRTDLHVFDGELTDPKLPLVLGHEIVGEVAAKGEQASKFKTGERVGVAWLGHVCGVCPYCKT
jgi:alcohol dehydrogenase, propanol-preferring